MRLIVTYEDTVRFYHRTFYYIDVSGRDSRLCYEANPFSTGEGWGGEGGCGGIRRRTGEMKQTTIRGGEMGKKQKGIVKGGEKRCNKTANLRGGDGKG